MHQRFSLWLIPPSKIKKQLEVVVQQLSQTHNAPNFEPHLTLLGDFEGNQNEVIKKTELLAKSLEPLTLTLEQVSFSTTYYQSVFIRVKATAELMEANLKAKDIFGLPNTLFMPHISLLYGDFDMKTKEEAAKSVMLPTISFAVKSIELTPSTPNPSEWIHLHTASLIK
jgi:2'-5' RNA ligase